jgi:cardiolipin synthase A/B
VNTPTASDRWITAARRTAVGVVTAPFVLATAMTLVDSYRRRGKRRAVSFPTGPPATVPVGDGEVTTYTFGNDLFDDMLVAIDGARRQILFETYIWKGDQIGQRFKTALEAAAERGVEVYCIYDSFANLVVSPRFKRFPPSVKVLRYPVYAAGWRPFDLRRYGRDHSKILVVDDAVGFVGGYNIGDAYATEWRDTHVRITGPGVWDLKRAFADFWNLNRRRRSGPASGRCCWRPRPRGSPRSGSTGTCPGCGCSRSGRCTSRRSPGPAATSG